ncbi:hypothetical protein J3R30DRAFT_1333826 [Lentinula aciculospora]|uniref:Protein kinase domain-containing protein n=1 Tax=Lentinula aciculospora TaxID=153920 RepID=A0A9W9AL06_9AGAR|nr:hypothetical protein J3R30DRAFT_1333826 [Lentinula aciculospora]
MSSSTPWLSNSFASSSQLDYNSTALTSSLQAISLRDSTLSESLASGHFASFVTLVAGLERNLHTEDPLFLNLDILFSPIRTVIASGASSRVEKASWNGHNFKGKYTERWGSFVALKFIRHHTDASRAATNWRQLLSEVRALLHEPIRYHPNIVRLLGISWGVVDGRSTNFPALILELSEMGTLAQLQLNLGESLPFDIKKKLCWDVAKGISILHACSVVHGDLKHENVLVYPNRDPDASIKYVAKISDFGGSVMDLGADDFRSLHTPTRPWLAPEFFFNNRMLESELKLTDVYALGLLVWRVILDGENPYQWQSNSEPISESQIHELKCSNDLLGLAKESILNQETRIDSNGIEVLHYVFENTIQSTPSSRNLVHAIAALQVDKMSEIKDILQKGREENHAYDEYLANKIVVPGKHGLTQDSLGVYLAVSNTTTGDYDFQHKGPGFRPTISPPPQGQFLFESHRLKTVLDWDRQVILLRELEAIALINPESPSTPTQISPAIAAFYVFKCHCYEFGTKLNSVKACHWLKSAALSEQECEETNLARAWCWRFHITYNVFLDVNPLKILDWIWWAIVGGHRKCISEAESLVQLMVPESRSLWKKALLDSRDALSTRDGGIGMPFFHPVNLRRNYHLTDFEKLDQDIQAELAFRGVQSIDDIYVNRRGDGLLHLAAGFGLLNTLKFLVQTYRPDIDKPNSSREETPLISACRGGHLACALYLIDLGAAPEADRHSLERPLWWLSSFKEDEMPIIADRLVRAGASLTFPPYPSFASCREEVRKKYVLSDYENFLLLPASPLSRAVMMESLPAVQTLLTIGANPLEGLDEELNPATGLSVCPMVVAAVLTLPDILKVMLDHVDARTTRPYRLFSEIAMLEMALDCKVTIGDPMSVDRRVSRLGSRYKESLTSTLRMLHEREKIFQEDDDEAKKNSAAKASAVMLSRLASLGRFNILRNLLELGHSAKGYAGSFPIVSAVEENRESIFRLLVNHGANPLTLYDLPSQNRKRTLLQVLAERPRRTRSGIGIAQALLEKGVPVDFVNPDYFSQEDLIVARPAFSSPVQNQDFELADMCLKHGANVDMAYVAQTNTTKITVLGELARSPTERNVDSLEYLLGLERSPSFVVIPSTGQTVFHQSLFFWATTDLQRRILGQMVRMIVAKDVHLSDQVIRHQIKGDVVGIPFNVALSGNLEVFTALLDCVPSVSQNPTMYFENGALKLVMLLRAIIANFPQLPEHVAVMNRAAGVPNDKSMEMEWMERYKLILYRLEEIMNP